MFCKIFRFGGCLQPGRPPYGARLELCAIDCCGQRWGEKTALMGEWRNLQKEVLARMGGVCSTQDVEAKDKLLIGEHEYKMSL